MNDVDAVRPGGSTEAFLTRLEHALDVALGARVGVGIGVDVAPGTVPEAVLAAEALIHSAARGLCLAPGAKRARPMLTHLLGRAAGAPESALLEASVAIELIHSASLLHDDVVDEGALRRGRATANAREGNAVAVLTGDAVLARALQLLARYPRVSARAIDVVADMAHAAVLEVRARRDVSLSPDGWIGMAEGKTGALFGLCGFAAGMLAPGTHEDSEARGQRFDVACRRLGIAFQIADDVADLFGDEGQDPLGDLREGNPSYPVLLAAARSPALARDLRAHWSLRGNAPDDDNALPMLARRVLESGAVEESMARAAAEVRAAESHFGPEGSDPRVAEVLRWAKRLAAAPRAYDKLAPAGRSGDTGRAAGSGS